jgi:hypothetical protein
MPTPGRIATTAAVVAALAASIVSVVIWRSAHQEQLPMRIPGVSASWTNSGTDDTLHAGQGPEFPTKLVGWQLQAEWADGTRAFTGSWSSLCGEEACPHRYPATMNGCANQRFLIRWRSLGGPVLFAYGEVTGDVGTIADQQLAKPTDRGWAELTGCSWPLWQYVAQDNGSNLGDIAVAVQHWQAAA